MSEVETPKQPLILHVPEEINQQYNGSITQLAPGAGTLVGNDDKLQQIDDFLNDPETPNIILLGEQGIGKTALVEELLYRRLDTDHPLIVAVLSIETLGELPENVMVGRMKTLQDDMTKVDAYTAEQLGHHNFQLVLFIDEVHKLHAYGLSNDTSLALNALKDGMARGKFPLITATTDYEYRKNIATDPAFDRRLHNIVLQQPDKANTIAILKRRASAYKAQGKKFHDISDHIYERIVDLTDAYIRNQVNPAKSLSILGSLVGYSINRDADIDEKALQTVFDAEGFNIRLNVTADHVNQVVKEQIKGQPIAVSTITDTINKTFYTKRDIKRPIATIFAVGTTGTGKALRNDEPILTSQHGQPVWVKNGDLQPGMLVYNRHGQPVEIASIHPQGQLDQYQVTLADGRTIVTNNEHLFSGYEPDSDELITVTVQDLIDRSLTEQPFSLPMNEPIDLPKRADCDDNYQQGITDTIAYEPYRLLSSTDQRQALLQGIFDAVGGVTDDGVPVLRHYDRDLLVGVQRLLVAQGLKAILRPHKHIANLYELLVITDAVRGRQLFTSRQVKRLVITDHDDNPRLTDRVAVQSIEKLDEPAEMTCIYLNDEEHLYLAGESFIVTHNTQTAKALAQAFYGRSDAMVVLNGGDYSGENDTMKALHKIGDAVSVNKQQLILLDEIEKSHRNVQMAYMRLVDEGLVTDSLGIERSINNTIVMATSNLGAKIFSELKNTMNWDAQEDSNVLTETMSQKWANKVDDVRRALEKGDAGLNNGIKPEFLDRFSLFVPYMGLSNQTKAEIAMNMLQRFADEERVLGYHVVYPDNRTEEEWQKVINNPYAHYKNVNELAIMIAEDIISSQSDSAGARAITRFIETHVKVKVSNAIANEIKHGRDPKSGIYYIQTNGNAVTDSGRHGTADVKVEHMSDLEVQRLNRGTQVTARPRRHVVDNDQPRTHYTRTTRSR